MPHFILEYSANLDSELDIDELFIQLREAALATGMFPPGGIRFRARQCEKYLIADGNPDNAFVHLDCRVGHGRTLEVKQAACERIFDRLKQELAGIFDSRPLAISFYMHEADPDLSYKHNNIHEYMKKKDVPG